MAKKLIDATFKDALLGLVYEATAFLDEVATADLPLNDKQALDRCGMALVSLQTALEAARTKKDQP
jgi:hypothetical protein